MWRATLIHPGNLRSHLHLEVRNTKTGGRTGKVCQGIDNINCHSRLLGIIHSGSKLAGAGGSGRLGHSRLIGRWITLLEVSRNLVKAIDIGTCGITIGLQVVWVRRANKREQILNLRMRKWATKLITPGRHHKLAGITRVRNASANDPNKIGIRKIIDSRIPIQFRSRLALASQTMTLIAIPGIECGALSNSYIILLNLRLGLSIGLHNPENRDHERDN